MDLRRQMWAGRFKMEFQSLAEVGKGCVGGGALARNINL